MSRTETEQHQFRKNWRNWLADILADISDVRKTEQDWLSSSNPRGYDEEICGYFDDLMCGQGLAWAVKENVLTAEESRQLTPFHQIFDKFVDSMPHDNTYRDPEIVRSKGWAEVAKIAGETYQLMGRGLRADL